MRAVGIVSDSAIDIPPELARELDIVVAPVVLIVDDDPNVITLEIDRSKLIDRLAASKKFSTAGANVGDFCSAYSDALTRAQSLVVLTLATQISVTYNSALTAADLTEGATVKVYDTHGVYVGHTALAIAAARRARAGASLEEVSALVESGLPRSQGLMISPNLALIRGIGRVTEGGVDASRDLRLAIVRLADGKIAPIDAAADYDEAIEKVVRLVEAELRPGEPICGVLGHSRQPEAADRLQRKMRERLTCTDFTRIDESPLSVVLGGLGAIGFGFCPLPT